jgi:hypothetical protein
MNEFSVFNNRQDDNYLNVLEELLSIDGKKGLIEKAVPITKPFTLNERLYKRCCRIDFLGISASNLFDLGGNIVKRSVAKKVEEIFRDCSELNRQNIFVKLRFLLVYPFSAFAFSRMQAESTRNRSSIAQPRYSRNLDFVDQVDEDIFMQSNFLKSQTLMLEQLQEWTECYGWKPTSINKYAVRFTPISPGQCTLIINDTAFIDAYMLSKETRESKVCCSNAPVVMMEKDKSPDFFHSIDDHFRYLWDLDVTLFCEDATFYQRGRPNTLSKFKKPSQVSFDTKANVIKSKNEKISSDVLQSWMFRSAHLFRKYTLEPSPTPRSEALFITCSWRSEKDYKTLPNKYARDLSSWIENDFGRKRSAPLISVYIMEGAAGQFLTNQLYARLKETTLGLILLTADIDSTDTKMYSKPNIYHELGYLMRQLGNERVALVVEKGVEIPSNIHDVIRIEFPRDKLALFYREIVQWLSLEAHFNKTIIADALNNHMARIDELIKSGAVTSDEGNTAKKRLANDIDNFDEMFL